MIVTNLEVRSLSLIHNKSHQNVKLLIKWKGIPRFKKRKEHLFLKKELLQTIM